MDNKKYRILYNDKMVIDVVEDLGTTYLGEGSGYMVLVDTKENAKVMLEAIGINTARLFNTVVDVPIPDNLLGVDYLDSLNERLDPNGLIEGGIV